MLVVFSITSHASTWDRLIQVETDLKAQQVMQQDLTAKQTDIQSRMDKLRAQMIAATKDIRLHEAALLKLQQQQAETQQQMTATKDKLTGQRKSLAQLVLALQRLDRLPPQALLARPSAPIDTARSFYLMQHILPDLSQRAAAVKDTLAQLTTLQASLDSRQMLLHGEESDLNAKRSSLQNDLVARQKLLAQTQTASNSAAAKTATLAKQAKDLHDLLDQLSKVEKPVKTHSATALSQNLRSWFGSGKATMPVEGKVTTGYGQEIAGGGQSQGLDIAASAGAIVTAPGDGVVRFAGPFRQYKLLVIIQHGNGDHSLLGGMQELYTRVGAKVAAGEPIGKLPSAKIPVDKMEGDSVTQASLYYERRRNGKPIDPREAG